MQTPNLLEGEKVLYETKPLPQLKSFYVFNSVLAFGFFTAIVAVPATIGLTIEEGPFIGLIILGLWMFAMLIIAGLTFVFAEASYKQRYYWITTHRVIYRRGTFGYTMSSLPYERISDVIISRTFWENMFGFGSVQVQTLAGQISAAAVGSEGYLQAIPEPEKVQQLILKAMKDKIKI
jgi:uncharacterized membrane protein YdbT with pleckstrin-like domain